MKKSEAELHHQAHTQAVLINNIIHSMSWSTAFWLWYLHEYIDIWLYDTTYIQIGLFKMFQNVIKVSYFWTSLGLFSTFHHKNQSEHTYILFQIFIPFKQHTRQMAPIWDIPQWGTDSLKGGTDHKRGACACWSQQWMWRHDGQWTLQESSAWHHSSAVEAGKIVKFINEVCTRISIWNL
jgi:hypothetical protein